VILMAFLSNIPTERPDHVTSISGDQGDPMNQEPGSGKQVYRRGAGESQADIDIGAASSPRDLDGGNNDFDSGAKNAGGAEALAGEITSDDSANFNVLVDWLDNDENVVITHDPASLQGVSDVEFNLVMRSDRFKVRVEDTSGGQNRIHGTVNSH